MEARHHEGDNDDGEHFDDELGEAEIGCAEEYEDQRQSEALNAERDDGEQPTAGKDDEADADGGEAKGPPFVEGEAAKGRPIGPALELPERHGEDERQAREDHHEIEFQPAMLQRAVDGRAKTDERCRVPGRSPCRSSN